MAAPDNPFARGIAARHAYVWFGKERLLEARVRELVPLLLGPGSPPAVSDLRIALARHPERVLVETKPDVQAVVTDAAVLVADRGALAAQAPAPLVDVNLVTGLSGEVPCRGHACTPAANDRDSYRSSGGSAVSLSHQASPWHGAGRRGSPRLLKVGIGDRRQSHRSRRSSPSTAVAGSVRSNACVSRRRFERLGAPTQPGELVPPSPGAGGPRVRCSAADVKGLVGLA